MKLFTLFGLCLLGFYGQSQTIMPCLYDHGVELLEKKYPGYKEELYHSIETNAHTAWNRSDVLKIKVVFHVVYKEAEENISDEKILKQLNILNQCYRRQNEDADNLRDIFLPVAGDAMIEFELAEIRRVNTNTEFEPTLFALPDEVKQSSEGGSDIVDPDHFMNIWICKMKPINIFGSESPLLGYAYPPDGLVNWPDGTAAPTKDLEGVVLDYRVVGTDEFIIQGFGTISMAGRTAVHEVGHYLGLRHISGDAGVFGTDCSGSDGVEDTPVQGKQSEFDCNTDQNTCGEGETDDLPDMIENYMDYSEETCQNTFTNGQIALMRGVLMNQRKGLLESFSSSEEVVIENKSLVYPNPVHDVIQFKNINLDDHSLISISSVMGQRVDQLEYHQNKGMDVSTLSAGVYYLSSPNLKPLRFIKL